VNDRAELLYDSDCGFCRWALGWVLRWDRRELITPVALQDRRAGEVLAAMDAAERMTSWHLATPDGVRSGGAAAAPLARMLPGGGALASAFELAPGLVERAYRRISGARGRLGPRLPRRSIARADELIAARRDARAESGLA
jgi:predicted DCC family thiol-disulfide oxidoreductase YuxK